MPVAYTSISATATSRSLGIAALTAYAPLPEILVPGELPPFLSGSYSIDMDTLYADIKFMAGHGRKRRIRQTVPRIVVAELDLSTTQMQSLDNWFENVLNAGEKQFSAQFAPRGPGPLEWWAARWMEPYTATPDGTERWVVSGKLQLTGSGYLQPPASSGLQVYWGMVLNSSLNALTVPLNFTVLFPLHLDAPDRTSTVTMSMLLDTLPALMPTASYIWMQEETYLLTEEGDKFLLE